MILRNQSIYRNGTKHKRDVQTRDGFTGVATLNRQTWLVVLNWPTKDYWTAIRRAKLQEALSQ